MTAEYGSTLQSSAVREIKRRRDGKKASTTYLDGLEVGAFSVVADVGIEEGLPHHHLWHPAQGHRDRATPRLRNAKRRKEGREGAFMSIKNTRKLFLFTLLPDKAIANFSPVSRSLPSLNQTHLHRQRLHALVRAFIRLNGLSLQEPAQNLNVGGGHVQHVVHGGLIPEKERGREGGRKGL